MKRNAIRIIWSMYKTKHTHTAKEKHPHKGRKKCAEQVLLGACCTYIAFKEYKIIGFVWLRLQSESSKCAFFSFSVCKCSYGRRRRLSMCVAQSKWLSKRSYHLVWPSNRRKRMIIERQTISICAELERDKKREREREKRQSNIKQKKNSAYNKWKEWKKPQSNTRPVRVFINKTKNKIEKKRNKHTLVQRYIGIDAIPTRQHERRQALSIIHAILFTCFCSISLQIFCFFLFCFCFCFLLQFAHSWTNRCLSFSILHF